MFKMWTHNFSISISVAKDFGTPLESNKENEKNDIVPEKQETEDLKCLCCPDDQTTTDTLQKPDLGKYLTNNKAEDLEKCPCTEENKTNLPQKEPFGALQTVEPGKGLLAYSKRLSKFCKPVDDKADKKLLLEVPRDAKCFPKERPENQRLSFLDDPPYCTSVKRYMPDFISDLGNQDKTKYPRCSGPCTSTCPAKMITAAVESARKESARRSIQETNKFPDSQPLKENSENTSSGSCRCCPSENESTEVESTPLTENSGKTTTRSSCTCISCPRENRSNDLTSPNLEENVNLEPCSCTSCCRKNIANGLSPPHLIENDRLCSCTQNKSDDSASQKETAGRPTSRSSASKGCRAAGFTAPNLEDNANPRPCSCTRCQTRNKSNDLTLANLEETDKSNRQSCVCKACHTENKSERIRPRPCSCTCCRKRNTSADFTAPHSKGDSRSVSPQPCCSCCPCSRTEENSGRGSPRRCACTCCPKQKKDNVENARTCPCETTENRTANVLTDRDFKENSGRRGSRPCSCTRCCRENKSNDLTLPKDNAEMAALRSCTCKTCQIENRNANVGEEDLKENSGRMSPRRSSGTRPENKSNDAEQTTLRHCTCTVCQRENRNDNVTDLKENSGRTSPRLSLKDGLGNMTAGSCTCTPCPRKSRSPSPLKEDSAKISPRSCSCRKHKSGSPNGDETNSEKEFKFLRNSLPAWVTKHPIKK